VCFRALVAFSVNKTRNANVLWQPIHNDMSSPTVFTDADFINLSLEARRLEKPIERLDTRLRNMEHHVAEMSSAYMSLGATFNFLGCTRGICKDEPNLAEPANEFHRALEQFEKVHTDLARSVAHLQARWEQERKPRLVVLAYVKAKEQAAELCFKTRKAERDHVRRQKRDGADAQREKRSAPRMEAARPKQAKLDFVVEEEEEQQQQQQADERCEQRVPEPRAATE